MEGENGRKFPRRIKFRIGPIAADADASWADDGTHPNVLCVVVRPAFYIAILASIILWLPQCAQDVCKSYFPGLFLPERLILKKMKSGWEDEFDNEKAMYGRMKDLQGDVIPILYGEAKYEGTRALLVSFVDGVRLSEVTDLSVEEVKRKIEHAFLPLQHYGVVPDDLKLDNFILVGDRIVIIDLEHVYEPVIPGKVQYTADSAVSMVLTYYKMNKKSADMGYNW